MEGKEIIENVLGDNNIIPPIDPEKFKCSNFIKIDLVLLNAYNKPKFTLELLYRKDPNKDFLQVVQFIIEEINRVQCLAIERLYSKTDTIENIHVGLVQSYCLECFRIKLTENLNQLANLSYYDLYDKDKCVKDKYCVFNSDRVRITFTKINFDFLHLSSF